MTESPSFFQIFGLCCILFIVFLKIRYQKNEIPLFVLHQIQTGMKKGFSYVEFNYFNFLVPYQGSLDDGRWWDSILITWALLQAGEPTQKLQKAVDIMLRDGVQRGGGIAYGLDFEYAPDADDTGLLVLLMTLMQGKNKENKYAQSIELNSRWLHTMQNDDGGFPAFDKHKTGDSLLLQLPFKLAGITNSAQIFDPSSVDVTAHILEGFG